MLLSSKPAWSANQCPLKRLGVRMSPDTLTINPAAVQIPAFPKGYMVCTLQEAATGRRSL